jgi:predicted TPR repeat methyltransferase
MATHDSSNPAAAAVSPPPAQAGVDAMLAAWRAGDPEDCAARCRQILAIDPGQAHARLMLGVMAAQRGDSPQALAHFDAAAERAPEMAAVHNNRGHTLHRIGRWHEAVASYDRALALGRVDANALSHRADALHRIGRFEAALQSYDRAIALEPDLADAMIERADLLIDMGRPEDAAAALEQARGAGADGPTIDFALAALGLAPIAAASPPGYVRQLFDEYAERFDSHLVGHLGYRGPALIDGLISRLALPPVAAAVDLGCGTGLCGPILRPRAARLVGVDLAPKMLEQAQRRGLYDELVCEELTAFAAGTPAQFELAVAADVMNYFGDLAAPLAALRGMLRPGGWLVFTIELDEAAAVALQRSRRFAHSADHVREAASATGFSVEAFEHGVLRRERNADVACGLWALRLSGPAAATGS